MIRTTVERPAGPFNADPLSRAGKLVLLTPTEHLQQRSVTVDEAEHLSIGALAAMQVKLVDGKPFAKLNDRWEEMKSAMLPGDEIWIVSSAQSDWDQFVGHERVQLIRSGKVVLEIVTARN